MMVASSDAAWGPLTAEQLSEVLRLAAEVADADDGHDLLTALDVLNKDVLSPNGRPQMYEQELRQVARALHAEIPAGERGGWPGGEVAGVSAWLGQHVREQRRFGSGGNALAGLFRRAAARIDAAGGGDDRV
jgi:hypothetical protein